MLALTSLSLIFVVCENTVKVFSTATGKETHVLKPAAADAQPPTKAKQPDPATITGLLLHCNNRRQILCSTLGGLVCVYDAEDMTLLKVKRRVARLRQCADCGARRRARPCPMA